VKYIKILGGLENQTASPCDMEYPIWKLCISRCQFQTLCPHNQVYRVCVIGVIMWSLFCHFSICAKWYGKEFPWCFHT